MRSLLSTDSILGSYHVKMIVVVINVSCMAGNRTYCVTIAQFHSVTW